MIILDSSSLILLAKVRMLDILIKNTMQKLVIPEQVYVECTTKMESFDAQLIEKRVKEHAILTRQISNIKLYNKILDDFNLGKGEAEAISLCIELKSGIITDDKKAINTCRVFKIGFTTVAKIVTQFYNKKYITLAEANITIKELQKFGRYSDEIIQKLKEDLK